MSGFLTSTIQPGMGPDAVQRMNELRARFGLPELQSQIGSSSQTSGIGGFLARVAQGQQQPQAQLPPLPKIPALKEAPSRLNDRRIAGAARSRRVAAANRKGRASTILGGSIGAEPERKTLLGA